MAAMARHLGFPIGTIWAIFYLQHIPKLPNKFRFGFSVQEKKRKIDFQDGRHLGFPIGTILIIFDVQVIPILRTNFWVNWPFCSGEEVKHRFQNAHIPNLHPHPNPHSYPYPHPNPDGHVGFQIGTILANFDLQGTPMLPTMFSVKWPFGSGEEAKNRFSELGFPIRMILNIFYLQFTPIFPTKFRVIWPFGSGEEAKNGFSR